MNEDDVVLQYSEDAHLWHYPEEPLNFVPEKQTDKAENIVQEENVENIVQEENVDEQDTGVQGDNIQNIAAQSTDFQSTGVQSTGVQSTLDQGNQGTAAINVDEVGPSNPTQQEEIKEHTASDDETIAQIMHNLDRPRGIHISEPAQKVFESSSEPEALDPKDKRKGIMKETMLQ